MMDFPKFVKVVPVTAGVVLAGTWATPAYGFFPRPSVTGEPIITGVAPPLPTTPLPTSPIPIPPVPDPIPTPDDPNPPGRGPDPFPPPPPPPYPCPIPPPPCPEPPASVPEPTTIVTGLIGLATAGAAHWKRRMHNRKA